MTFKDLGLEEFINTALAKQGITEPTEIQYKTIPLIKSGVDVVGKSQTGSGKTYAYGLSAIENIDFETKYTQVLIICPTRELALQVTDELRKITEYKEGCKIVPVFGGSSIDRQIQSLKKGSRIIVGTPGRIMDHLRRKTIKLHELKMLVLDEADEMLDMGFREDIETILKTTNNTHQTVMFSATMPKAILDITKNYMKNPVYIEVEKNKQPLDIKEYFVNVGGKDKKNTLKELLTKQKPNLAIVFCNTKKMVTDLQKTLKEENIDSVALHGDMRQSERTRVMKSIKSGTSNLLIATDVAARGIDINNVDIVYNYDLPNNSEYYTHRIGRTARAGKSGEAYTIINSKNQLSEFIALNKESGDKVEEYICSYTKTKSYKVIPQDNEKSQNKQIKKENFRKKSFGKDRNNRFSDNFNKSDVKYKDNKDKAFKDNSSEKYDRNRKNNRFNKDNEYTEKNKNNRNKKYQNNKEDFSDSISKAKEYYKSKTTYKAKTDKNSSLDKKQKTYHDKNKRNGFSENYSLKKANRENNFSENRKDSSKRQRENFSDGTLSPRKKRETYKEKNYALNRKRNDKKGYVHK